MTQNVSLGSQLSRVPNFLELGKISPTESKIFSETKQAEVALQEIKEIFQEKLDKLSHCFSSETAKQKELLLDGNLFKGAVKETGDRAEISGLVELTLANGNSFKGEWPTNTEKTFTGELTLPTHKITYSGEWKSGQIDGKGTFNYCSGQTHSGKWKRGKKHGAGTSRFPYKSQKVVGEWYNGQFHGKCTRFLKDSDNPLEPIEVETHWNKGVKDGIQTKQYKNGWIVKNRYIDGIADKDAFVIFPDGNIYEGGIRDLILHGVGRKTFVDSGWINTGRWVNGKLQGKGTIITPDGEEKSVVWKDGKRDFYHK